VVLVGFLASAANLAALVGFPLLLAGANEASSLQIAWVMLPGAVGTAVMGVVAGRLTDAIGGRRPILVGVSALAGVMILASAWAGVSLGAMAVCAGLLGFGFALVNTPLSATLARLVEPDELALALSLNVMAFFVGGSFGTTALLGIASFDAGTSAAGIASGFSAAFGWLVVPMVVALGLAWGLPRGAR
jgi:MFS family permease